MVNIKKFMLYVFAVMAMLCLPAAAHADEYSDAAKGQFAIFYMNAVNGYCHFVPTYQVSSLNASISNWIDSIGAPNDVSILAQSNPVYKDRYAYILSIENLFFLYQQQGKTSDIKKECNRQKKEFKKIFSAWNAEFE